LERWQDATEQALGVLPPDQLRDRMPTRPAAITAEAVSTYAETLVKAEAKVRDSVARAAAAAGKEASTRLAELDTEAAGLRAGQQGALAIAVTEGEQLLDPVALDPVVAAETSARDAARQYRAEQTAAQSQIQQAASLDTAIQAGRARLSAVNALYGLLADAK